MKRLGLICLTVLSLIGFSFSAIAEVQRPADATMTFSGGSVAAGVGYTWGDGALDFEGKSYPFTVSGLTFIDIGAERVDGAGTVYNLKKVEDVAGTYVAAGAGATLAGGGSVVALENQNWRHRAFPFDHGGIEAQSVGRRDCREAEVNFVAGYSSLGDLPDSHRIRAGRLEHRQINRKST